MLTFESNRSKRSKNVWFLSAGFEHALIISLSFFSTILYKRQDCIRSTCVIQSNDTFFHLGLGFLVGFVKCKSKLEQKWPRTICAARLVVCF